MQGNTQNVPDTLRFFFFTLSGIYAVGPSSNFCNFTSRLHQKQSQKVRNQKFSCMRRGGGHTPRTGCSGSQRVSLYTEAIDILIKSQILTLPHYTSASTGGSGAHGAQQQ